MQDEPDDRMLTRTILQALTQICGPISFNLFAKICHCLVLTKQFIKRNRPANTNVDMDDLDEEMAAVVGEG